MKAKPILTAILVAVVTYVTSAQALMTAETLWKLGRVSLMDVSPDGKTALYSVRHYDVEQNSSSAKVFAVDVTTGNATEMANAPGNLRYLKNGRLLGEKNGSLVLAKTSATEWEAITPKGFGDNLKAVELADGRLMVLFTKPYQFRQSVKEAYQQYPHANVKMYDDLMYRHWNEWSDDLVNHLNFAIYDPAKNTLSMAKDIMGQEPFDVPLPPMSGSETYTASPDGKTIAYVCKKRTGKDFAQSTNSEIYFYSIETGQTTLFTQGMMGYDNLPQFSPSGKQFAWLSMPTDGFESDVNQLWVYDFGSKTKRLALTEEFVEEFMWVDEGKIAYLVPKAGTQQIGVVDVKAKNGSQGNLLTSGDYNYGHFVLRGQTLVAERQDINHATEIFKVAKGTATNLSNINTDLYAGIAMSRVEKRMVKTTDDQLMLTWVIYPPNFDPNKKYPTLLYCQGGPQSMVGQFYSYRWNFQLMAANGYIVVAPNRRGLPGFGQEWNAQISKDWGGQAMRDYLSAIDDVAKEPYVDAEHLGAVGASYGGYSVYMLAGIHQHRFKAFISHCGLFNLESWYGTTEELFFANWDIGGPYWGEPIPESYLKYSPHRYVQNWDTPMLVIHGGKDFRVPETQGMEAFQAAQLQGIPSKFLYFPEEGHWVLQPQNGMVWHTEFFKWLDQWLK